MLPGSAEQTDSRIKRFAGSLGAIELVPVVGLAIWALSLRVAQYGWTTERIFAGALIVIFSCYAFGYASAVVGSSAWLKRIEITNIATAYVVLGIFLALFSPLVDPARLMVASQVARLQSREVQPEKFDFVALKFDGARWGNAALAALKQLSGRPDSQTISLRAVQALDMKAGLPDDSLNKITKTAQEKAAVISVYPAGRTLPAEFFESDAGITLLNGNGCFNDRGVKCVARYVSLQPGGPESIILNFGYGLTQIVEQDASGKWHSIGTISGPITCDVFKEGLQRDDLHVEPHPHPDIVIRGERFTVLPPAKPCKPIAN